MESLITLIWIADFMNIPGLEFLDTTLPLNGWFWFFAILFGALSKATKIKESN